MARRKLGVVFRLENARISWKILCRVIVLTFSRFVIDEMEYCEKKKKKITLIELILIFSVTFLKLILAALTISLSFRKIRIFFYISREMNDKIIFSFKFVNISNRINIL